MVDRADSVLGESLPRERYSTTRGDAARVAFAALVYFGIARLSLLLVFKPEGIAAVWPPEGVFLSAILLARPRLRPWLVGALCVTDVLVELLAGTPPLVSLIYAFALTGSASFSAWLLLHFLGQFLGFTRIREMLGFLLLAVLVTNATMSLLAAAASHFLIGASFWQSWQWWAASDGIGNLFVTPVVLSWASFAKSGRWKGDVKGAAELAVLLASLTLTNILAFAHADDIGAFSLFLTSVTLPFMLWAALRFGVRGVSAALLAVGIIGIRAAVADWPVGASLGHDALGEVISIQLYLALMALPMLVLGAVMTERDRTFRALKESESHYRHLFEHEMLGTLLLEPDGAVRAVNPSLARIFAFASPADVMESLKDGATCLFAEPQRTREVLELAAEGTDVATSEEWYRRQDGSTFLGRQRAVGVKDESGNMMYCDIRIEDITEEKATEAALRASEEQLRQSQRLEAIGQLAGGIAHDFNNLLTAITGYSQLLLARDGRESLESSARVDVEEIRHAAERGASLTHQILAFSRRQTLRSQRVCLNDVLYGMESLLGRTLGEDVELKIRVDSELGLCEIDVHQFEQVLMNLAVNARDAMPGGGRLALETGNTVLDERYCRAHPEVRPGQYVTLTVTDTGQGMDSATASHIFEPFYTTKPPGKGTGLGLSTAYGIVRQSGGSIRVSTALGKGTTFTIHMPRVSGAASPTALCPPGEASTEGGHETILVVEDEEALRRLAARILKGLGYTVLTAASADEALYLLSDGEGSVDLLLTDVVLPGTMQGHDLVHRLSAAGSQVRVLFMSGYAAEMVMQASRLEEGVNFLEKPFTPDSLARKVREVLDQPAG